MRLHSFWDLDYSRVMVYKFEVLLNTCSEVFLLMSSNHLVTGAVKHLSYIYASMQLSCHHIYKAHQPLTLSFGIHFLPWQNPWLSMNQMSSSKNKGTWFILKLKKWKFGVSGINFLRMILWPGEIVMDPTKLDGIKNWPVPIKLKNL